MRRGADYALNKINSSWYGMSKLSLIIPGLGKAKMSAECQEWTLPIHIDAMKTSIHGEGQNVPAFFKERS